MAWYRVEMEGSAREVFDVEADSPEEARENWADGHQVILEAYGMGVVSVELGDEA